MLRNSTGTARMRSTTCSPATVSHSRLAQDERDELEPEVPEGMVSHQAS